MAKRKYNFSARSFFRILKISQTIADLDGKRMIDKRVVEEAVRFKIDNA